MQSTEIQTLSNAPDHVSTFVASAVDGHVTDASIEILTVQCVIPVTVQDPVLT